MASFQLQEYNIRYLDNATIFKDVMAYLKNVLYDVQFKRLTEKKQRKGLDKFAHGLHNRLRGRTKAWPDLYLYLPQGSQRFDNDPSYAFFEPAPKANLYFRIVLLGEESNTTNALKGHAFMPNSVIVRLGGPARANLLEVEACGLVPFMNMLHITATKPVRDHLQNLVQRAWGGLGHNYFGTSRHGGTWSQDETSRSDLAIGREDRLFISARYQGTDEVDRSLGWDAQDYLRAR